MKKINLIVIILLFVILINSCLINAQSEVVLNDLDQSLIKINADNIIFESNINNIRAYGQVELISDDFMILANEIILNYQKMILIANGSPITLDYEGNIIKGEKLELDINNKTANLYNAENRLDSIKFSGEKISYSQRGNPNLIVEEALFTTCKMNKPHYHFKAKSIQVYPGEKIIGKDISFWWGNQLIINLPKYSIQLDRDLEGNSILKNGVFIPEFGYKSGSGIVYKINYPYQINQKNYGNIFLSKESFNLKKKELNHFYQIDSNNKVVFNYLNDLYPISNQKNTHEEYREIGFLHQFNLRSDFELYFRNYKMYEPEIMSSNNLISKVSYKNDNFAVNAELDYNLSSKNRKESINIDYDRKSINYKLYLYFLDEELDKNKLSIDQKINDFSWKINYIDGYSTNYKPYGLLSYNLNSIYDFSIGYGHIFEDNINQHKVDSIIKITKALDITNNSELILNQSIKNINYLENNQTVTNYDTVLKLDIKNHLSSLMDLNNILTFRLKDQNGDPLFKIDQVDKERYIDLDSVLSINNKKIKEKWELAIKIRYSFLEQANKKLAISLGHEYDCYQYSIDYDFIDKTIGFGFSFKN